MNAATIQHLADLKKAGFDVSSLENQMRASPLLDRQGDKLMGGGLLRQEQFTKLTQQKADEERKYKAQIAQLQGLVNSGADEDSPLYKAALEIIAKQQEVLEQAGFTKEQIEEFSKIEVQDTNRNRQPNPQTPPQKEKEDTPMPEDNSKYLDIDLYQQQTEAQIFGSATLSAVINRKLAQADKLGIEVPYEKAANLGVNLRTAISQGKNIEQFLDEDLGIVAKQKEVDEANRKKEVDDAFARGKSEGLKEGGVPRRVVSRAEKHPIYDNVTSARKVEKPAEQQENKEAPRNKWGDEEIFRTRGNKNDRVQAAEEYHEKVLERSAAENSIPSE